MVNAVDSKSTPFGGAGSSPANISFLGSRSSVGRSSASHAEGPGFDPQRELFHVRYGVVGNMSGFHPVASGSIPGIGWFVLVLREVGGSIPPFSCFILKLTGN